MDEWTETWPVGPGHYWFFGWCSAMLRRDYDPEMVLVRVSETADSVAYVGDGRFIYRGEGAFGLWKRAGLPESPIGILNELCDERR